MRYTELLHAYDLGLAAQRITLTAGHLRVHRSALRTTLLYQLTQHYACGLDEAEARLATDDLTPFLASCIDAAKKRPGPSGRARANAPGFVRSVLTVAFPGQFSTNAPTGGSFSLVGDWVLLHDACAAYYPKSDVAATQRYRIRTMAKAMFEARITSPTNLPDRRSIETILRNYGCNDNAVDGFIMTYRVLLRHLQAQGLLPNAVVIHEVARPNERSLRTLPRDLFTQGGGLPPGVQPVELKAEQLLPLICPGIAAAMQEWKQKRGAVYRPRTKSSAMYGICHIVAEIAKNPELLNRCHWPEEMPVGRPIPTLHELRLWHLLELRHSSGAPLASVDNTSEAESANDDEPVQSPTTSLLFAALCQYATELREKSKVRGLVYPGWTRSVYAYVALVARGLNERALAGKPRWTRMNNALQAETKLMKRANKGTRPTGQKDKLVLVTAVNLGQIVCVGLPRWAKRARLREAAWQTAEAGAPATRGSVWRKRLAKARHAYLRALEEYVVVATMLADPVRIENHAAGWMGADDEYRIVFGKDARGARAIHSVTSKFTNDGGNNPAAAMKQAMKEIYRAWTWSPMVMDHDLLLKYLLEVRWPRIVRAKLLKEKDGSWVAMGSQMVWEELTTGARIPLFLSPEAKPGNLTYWNLPIAFVRGFSGMLRDIFKISLPPLKGRGKTRWAGLLSPHATRLLWASYWGGVRGHHGPRVEGGHRLSGWEIAVHATTDCEEVLRRDYTVVSAWAKNASRTASTVGKGDQAGARELWRHPHAYNAWMDRTYCHGGPLDWETERVPLPPGLKPLSEMKG
jgi:hypothetical protein